jgi:hypothetical protein
MAKAFGYIAFDTTGYAIRAYTAASKTDADRAAAIEMGDTLGSVRRFPVNTVRYSSEALLEPVDLRGNYGWSLLVGE